MDLPVHTYDRRILALLRLLPNLYMMIDHIIYDTYLKKYYFLFYPYEFHIRSCYRINYDESVQYLCISRYYIGFESDFGIEFLSM